MADRAECLRIKGTHLRVLLHSDRRQIISPLHFYIASKLSMDFLGHLPFPRPRVLFIAQGSFRSKN